MVQRKEYLDQLISWKDEQVIKVVTGIRRCGKSTLLMQFQQWLKENGVTQEQIVSVNFEELEVRRSAGLQEAPSVSERTFGQRKNHVYFSR